LIGVPMLKDGEGVDCMVIYRRAVRPLTDHMNSNCSWAPTLVFIEASR